MAVAKTKSKSFDLGPVKTTQGEDTSTRMALLLWGPSTCGKTTWAVTAPGEKLFLSLGDEEHKSIMHRKDVHIANLSGLTPEELFKFARGNNPFNLDTILSKDEDIATVVCDSLTSLTFSALQKAVADKVGAGRGFTPTMEQPGQSAYGGRNALVLEVLQSLMRVTAKHNVHFIATAHEADPTTRKDDRGNDIIEYVGVMLGGQLVNNMTYRWSEIWHMYLASESRQERVVSVRPNRQRRPIKTRMFSNKGEPFFHLDYDADVGDKGQMTISKIYDQWVDNGFLKIPVPVRKNK